MSVEDTVNKVIRKLKRRTKFRTEDLEKAFHLNRLRKDPNFELVFENGKTYFLFVRGADKPFTNIIEPCLHNFVVGHQLAIFIKAVNVLLNEHGFFMDSTASRPTPPSNLFRTGDITEAIYLTSRLGYSKFHPEVQDYCVNFVFDLNRTIAENDLNSEDFQNFRRGKVYFFPLNIYLDRLLAGVEWVLK